MFAGVSEGLESTQPVLVGKVKGVVSLMCKEGVVVNLFDVMFCGTVGIKFNKVWVDWMCLFEV